MSKYKVSIIGEEPKTIEADGVSTDDNGNFKEFLDTNNKVVLGVHINHLVSYEVVNDNNN